MICKENEARTILCSFADDLIFSLVMLDLGQINHLAEVADNAADGKE
jgi:hypothetical protein